MHGLAALADRQFPDERLAKIVLDPERLSGNERRVTPGFVAVRPYVERNFGRWRFAGGLPALATALSPPVTEPGGTVAIAGPAL